MILVTGANGHLGRRLLDALASTHPLRAVVRSERAAAMITTPGVEVRIVDYVDEAGMRDAASGCSHIVHLVGIIRETAGSTFASAHEETTTIVRRAAEAAGVGRIIYLSILGASADSRNDCLASKARAESILLTGDVPALILRVPMVLGEGDYASRALAARGRRRVCFQLRASSLEQPIYAGDVVAALVAG
ncbi:MAG: NAD(P)H-binding protein, partial [Gammaproteobacteria bacterium]